MRNVNGMNGLYNAEDAILLCEIMENIFELMYNSYLFNPRKCSSTSSLSGYIQRDLSKIIIALPTSNSIVEVFEKAVTGGFSGVNTRLVFDTQILLPNYTSSNYDKMSIDDSFKAYKRKDLKVCYKLKLNGEKNNVDRRVISKTLKLDKNNQYDFAMTKLIPTGCI